ncbi:hypothetical protein C8R47DRAFT_1079278 [Mycena vitilis]|nr:hypothetical protein C8R47DRAFT_1079278 [Mycena vitilis]
MARTRGYNPVEHGDGVNPLDDNDVPDRENVILKVKLTTSSSTLSGAMIIPWEVESGVRKPWEQKNGSGKTQNLAENLHPTSKGIIMAPTLSLSNPDLPAHFRCRDILFPKPGFRPDNDGPSSLLTKSGPVTYMLQNIRNKDLLRDPDFAWMNFITIPASGSRSTRVELPLQLEFILSETHTVKTEDLSPGMKFTVWMGEEDKKLSNYPFERDGSPANPSDYTEDIVCGDGWALQWQGGYLDVRGNVGKFGPVIKFVE